MRLPSCLAGAFLLLAAPAVQAQQQSAQFSIGPRDYVLQVPDGYCLPEGELVEGAERLAATDTTNFTLVTLYRCDEAMIYTDRWLLLKTARSTVNLEMRDRERWLAAWAAVFATQDERPIVEETVADISEQLGRELDIDTRRSTAGRDGNCVYTKGGAIVRTAEVRQNIRTAGGLCIVGERQIALHAYDDRKSASSDELLDRVKDTYAAIQPLD